MKKIFKIRHFRGRLLGANLLFLKRVTGITKITFQPREGSGLFLSQGLKGFLEIPVDFGVAPAVLRHHSWQMEELAFLKRILPAGKTFVAIDVGANAGLFSRQVLVAFPTISRAYLYEPEPVNFSCLEHNLAPFANAVIRNYALSDREGIQEFYLDPTNCGNYSLHKPAMPGGAAYTSISVPVRNIAQEAQEWRSHGVPIFYKSDTQGYDEYIATALDIRFWDDVFAGILELWRVEKPSLDWQKFRALLDRFPNKRFLDKADDMLTTDAVLAYLSGRDRKFNDLGFWK